LGAFFTVELLTMNVDPGWFGQIEREWKMLRLGDPSLNSEKFFRHVLSANKAGFLSAESLAAIANGLLTSPLHGASLLGRQLLERVGINRHPTLRLALAVSLVTSTGGDADFETGNAIFEDVMKDDSAEGRLRGLAAAALADSARLGRGMPVDVKTAVTLYDRAIELGHKAAAHNLGLYWEGMWGAESSNEALPNNARAIQTYKRGGTDARCRLRISNLLEVVQ
jgi:uncharacterized protein